MTRHYFVLNEFLVPRLLYLALVGRRPAVLHVWPVAAVNRRWLGRLHHWLTARGMLADPFELRPDWNRFIEKQGGVAAYGFYTDAYMKLEPVQDAIFGMKGLDGIVPDYAQAVRHRICTHYTDVHWLLLALRDLEKSDCVYGLSPEVSAFAEAYSGGKLDYRYVRPVEFRWMINVLQWAAATLFSCFWVLRHCVLEQPNRRRYRLGADLLQVLRHLNVTREMVDDDSQCLVVFRTPEFQNMYQDRIGSIDHCLVTEGVFPLQDVPGAIWLAVRDQYKLFRVFGGHPSGLYRRIASLPHWRLVFRALFNRFDLRYFLARDDYNGEHVIRTQELRRIGVTSLGIGHGLPTPNRISPIFRYLEFDYYFTFTRKFFETFYGNSFSPQTSIIGIGSIGLARDSLKLLAVPRPADIIVYLSHDLEAERYVEAMQEVARRFPDRKLLCKIKESQFDHGTADFFLDAIEAGPSNLIETRDDSYELMLKGRYAISNDSTIISEAIGFGLCTFMYDVYDEVAPTDGHPSMFRDYPEICIGAAEEFEARIREIEDGSWIYPREKMDGLIELSGLNPFDIIRETIGLEPKEPLQPMKIFTA